MQTLDDWLKTVHADGVLLARTRVAGPWGFAVQDGEAVVFHYVAEGHAYLRQPGTETRNLPQGTLIMFPHGSGHEMAHSPLGKAIPLNKFLARRDGVIDADVRATMLLCGQFDIDRHLALPALRALPSVVTLRAHLDPGVSPLCDTLRLLHAEVEASGFGNQVVVRNLLSSLFVYFIRAWGEAAVSGADDWFTAVRSSHIARALARIHETPEKAWTLEALAQEAGLSRAAFARQFNTSVGEPPHSYLTRWRMGIAAQLLEETDLRLAEIAVRVGYQSEFAFSRAFKRARDVPPHRFRRAAAS